MPVEPEEIQSESEETPDEESAMWGDAEPETPTDEFGEASEEDDSELTLEELEAALGKRLPRWVVPAGIVAFTALLVFIVWSIGSKMKEKPPGEEAITATTETVVDKTPMEDRRVAEDAIGSALIDSMADTTISGEVSKPLEMAEQPPKSFDEVVDIATEDLTASTDSVLIDTVLELPPEGLFHQLLNAEITREEMDAFDVTAYDEFLLIPIVTEEEARRRAMFPYPAELETIPDSLRALLFPVVDTMRIFSRMDSLAQDMDELRTRLGRSEDMTEQLRAELERAKIRTDSLRAVEIKRLAKIVDVMKPAYAATMLKDKKDQDIKDVLFRLKPRTAAKVLENFPPDRRSQLATSIVRK